jgi:hypothetical protein
MSPAAEFMQSSTAVYFDMILPVKEETICMRHASVAGGSWKAFQGLDLMANSTNMENLQTFR